MVPSAYEVTDISPGGESVSSAFSASIHNFYSDYIMRNAGVQEAQAGIKIAGRYINNLRYADDTTLWQKVKRN